MVIVSRRTVMSLMCWDRRVCYTSMQGSTTALCEREPPEPRRRSATAIGLFSGTCYCSSTSDSRPPMSIA